MMLCEGMSKCCSGCGVDHSTLALLLIALGIGAIVKYKAIKASSCQMLGKAVGFAIMIAAVLGLICSIHCAYKSRSCHSEKKACHDCKEGKEKGKSMEGMQLPPGHPDISTLKAPQQDPMKK